jgi:GNAT superfamily N-acetyltransferase
MTVTTMTITPVHPDSAPARACLAAYFGELDRRFPGGFDPGPPGPPEPWLPPRGAFLVATAPDGTPLGCVAVTRDGADTAEIKRLWVAAAARGTGLARQLMAAAEARARALGATTVRLDTHVSLAEAIAFYRREGWAEIPRYNDNPYAGHWFAKPLA